MGNLGDKGAEQEQRLWELREEAPDGSWSELITTGERAGIEWLGSITVPKRNNRIVMKPREATEK